MVVRPPGMVEVVIAVAKEVSEPVVDPAAFTNGIVVKGRRPS